MVGQKRVVLVEGPQRERGILKGDFKHKPRDRRLRFLEWKSSTRRLGRSRITQALPYDLVAQIEKILP